jgi:hypothetical protein
LIEAVRASKRQIVVRRQVQRASAFALAGGDWRRRLIEAG